jgi:hypothetical protein
MAELVSCARRDARRASLAETEALRFERRAEDAESNCATLLERARLAERRLENGLAAVSDKADDEVTKTKTKTKDEKETRVTDGVERDVSDESLSAALENSLRAELVGVREDLKRETTLAKSALRDLDDANFARDEAMSLLRQKERDLESLKESMKAAKAEETAILDAAREEASRDLKKCENELVQARASADDLNARLADALLDLDEVSSEKKRLAEALALEARETRDARDEAERLARQLADERESSRRRLREARAVADAKEAKHRLEQAEWEDAARLKRRERYAGETRASFSAGGPDRDPTGRDPTGRDPTVPRARTGEGADGAATATAAAAAAAAAAATRPSRKTRDRAPRTARRFRRVPNAGLVLATTFVARVRTRAKAKAKKREGALRRLVLTPTDRRRARGPRTRRTASRSPRRRLPRRFPSRRLPRRRGGRSGPSPSPSPSRGPRSTTGTSNPSPRPRSRGRPRPRPRGGRGDAGTRARNPRRVSGASDRFGRVDVEKKPLLAAATERRAERRLVNTFSASFFCHEPVRRVFHSRTPLKRNLPVAPLVAIAPRMHSYSHSSSSVYLSPRVKKSLLSRFVSTLRRSPPPSGRGSRPRR